MNFIKTPLEGLVEIHPKVFGDDRGYFLETYNDLKFKAAGLNCSFVQDNQSKSAKGVLRGLHFQKPPYAQGKLVSVVQGKVLDVVVDIRSYSKTYGQSFQLELNSERKNMLYVPPGFAHGFLTLEDETIFTYKCTCNYHPESEETILWNDTDLAINWGIENPIISEKDKNGLEFRNFRSPFTKV